MIAPAPMTTTLPVRCIAFSFTMFRRPARRSHVKAGRAQSISKLHRSRSPDRNG
ncbi:Uncharacterised protein [Mycobacteroides abscessus subsp. abscessus]|nr:Uncharacterised protein [Mycobacteroides abscessus subsp. abscessus]